MRITGLVALSRSARGRGAVTKVVVVADWGKGMIYRIQSRGG